MGGTTPPAGTGHSNALSAGNGLPGAGERRVQAFARDSRRPSKRRNLHHATANNQPSLGTERGHYPGGCRFISAAVSSARQVAGENTLSPQRVEKKKLIKKIF